MAVVWYHGAMHLPTTLPRDTVGSMDEQKAMTIRLPADQAEALDTVAAVDGQPVSQVIRMAIDRHIEERKQDAEFQDGLRQRIEHAQQMLPDD